MKKIPFKRRRKQLTNYRKRLKLIVSGKTRFVVRISNKYVNCQFIKYEPDGDITLVQFNSIKLKDFGFKGSKNLQSSYLAGFASGLKALKKGIKEAVLDIGLRSSIRNSRIYASLKGAIEAGVKIPAGENVMPSDELLKKEELSEIINKIKGGIK